MALVSFERIGGNGDCLIVFDGVARVSQWWHQRFNGRMALALSVVTEKSVAAAVVEESFVVGEDDFGAVGVGCSGLEEGLTVSTERVTVLLLSEPSALCYWPHP